ncbi:hypothetical protein [Pseudothauera nasutitermitis]|uniref:hypothetical protein n=1 Tax=Pseudothauera nasutitermitis TaxID=2565930 RepID=UPI001B3B2BD4|nr:hypothetical protein [Pseudothauera nasutitermitis]
MAAIEWFRLWHDMPNDPKWRTVARVSGQPITTVLSVALHLMVDASRNVTRGHVSVTAEDVASALDVTDEAVEAIFSAMQGRVLDGDRLSGWEKRQPKREDSGSPETGAKSAAERKREQREREKQAQEAAGKGGNSARHAASRDVTLDKDTDKDKSLSPDGEREGASAPGLSDSGLAGAPAAAEPPEAPPADGPTQPAEGGPADQPPGDDPPPPPPAGEKLPRALGVRELVAEGVERQHAEDWLKARKAKKLPLTESALDIVKAEAVKAGLTLPQAIARAAGEGWAGFKASWMARDGGSRTNGAPAPSTAHGGFDQRDYGTGGRL